MNYVRDLIDYLSRFLQWWVIVMPWDRGLRIRLGNRIKYLSPGVHAKFPFIDKVFIQGIRLRVAEVPVQTLSTSDRQVVTVTATIGFHIQDLRLLYETLYKPDTTIANIVRSHVADFVSSHDLIDCRPKTIENYVLKNMAGPEYGLSYDYIKIVGFAVVRTYRIIQDQQTIPYDESHLDRPIP